jgi:very-short-patch-repair endonuclease
MARHPLTNRARSLRLDQTQVERDLWNRLRRHQLGGWKWKRQVPRGDYIVDFLCADPGLVIELDGGQHTEAVAYDARRTAYLETLGLSVLRFWNGEIIENMDGVCETILRACEDRARSRTLAPFLRGEGRERGPSA